MEAGLPLLLVAALALIFGEGLSVMFGWWARPEYNHGYAIPLMALYLVWIRASELRSVPVTSAWPGILLVVLGILTYLAGELSALFVIVHFAFLVTLWGLVLAAAGWQRFRIIAGGLLYLVFMVPLPAFLQSLMTSEMQLVSSQLGTWMLRMVGISVYLEGNVIDLGEYQLQVVEACSGLRYLVPLLSLGVFFAFLFRGNFWQRAVIVLSTVPITIFMNSFRIAVNGVLVNTSGIEAAEGFLHFFEGWVIFMLCIALLLIEMTLIGRLSGRARDGIFRVEVPPVRNLADLFRGTRPGMPLRVAVVLLVAAVFVTASLEEREEKIPGHASFSTFPMRLGPWTGQRGSLTDGELEMLKLTDYLVGLYRRPGANAPVELYVAYYESQRKGISAHSPRACIPGSGWEFSDFKQQELEQVTSDGERLPVNRAVISMGDQQLLVYYWFEQRGRVLTNEYAVKWFIFWDSLTRGRTDGALVRVMTPIEDREPAEAADERLREFIQAAEPRLAYHIPQETSVVGALEASPGPVGHNTGR